MAEIALNALNLLANMVLINGSKQCVQHRPEPHRSPIIGGSRMAEICLSFYHNSRQVQSLRGVAS